ncbi:hypothetical protein FVE85_2142 [Porphyridium purpureum]|uniref:Uncharacterized protein n=1 Tax=Porphyridium purpureum TaxID=35688 RepID=A0A5J4YZV5_PORPP|nr:hypothetical protein FVE85_2142 [Porphyridium purpureum]|eukprot:POR9150..scf209_3
MVWIRVEGKVQEVLARAAELEPAGGGNAAGSSGTEEKGACAGTGANSDANVIVTRNHVQYVTHRALYNACDALVQALARDGGDHSSYSFEKVLAEDTSRLEFELPVEKAPRSAELDRRLRQIEIRAQNQAYAKMVGDVAPAFAMQAQLGENASASAFVSSLRSQTSMGGNVIATMLTCFGVGFFLAQAYYGLDHPFAKYVGGAVGLSIGLFLDAILVMARVHTIDKAVEKSKNVKKGKRE